ncbi:hypothetical protein ACE6H2_015307 [Prunus campanulata]
MKNGMAAIGQSVTPKAFHVQHPSLYIDDLEDMLAEAMLSLNTMTEDGNIEENPPLLSLFTRRLFGSPPAHPATILGGTGTKRTSATSPTHPDPFQPPPSPVLAGISRNVAGFTQNFTELVRVIPATKSCDPGMFSQPLVVY